LQLKKFAKNLVLEMALQAARTFLNEQIKDIEPEDVYNSIISGKKIWGNLPKNIKKKKEN